MKKMKFLIPALAVASVVPAMVTIASCGGDGKKDPETENISLADESQKTSTTSTNVTATRYEFNVKKTSNIANAETEDEIDVEVEDVETSNEVTVEVSELQYNPETGKCYVTITVSKEDGTLNEEDTVSFSLNFHFHKKGSKTDIWTKKINKFIIKHSEDQIWSGHFNDTDVTKVIKKTEAEKGEGTESIVFPINSTETWVESEATEDQYDLSKLNCYVLQNLDIKHFINTIELPDHSKKMSLTLKTDVSGEQSLIVDVPYNITEYAQYGAKARFTLLFTYDGNTVFQTIGGFSINYVESVEDEQIRLISSREQHYYNAPEGEKETGTNVISFILNNETTYAVEDFNITTSNERINIGEKKLFNTEIESKTYQILTVSYSIGGKTNPEPRPVSDNLYNVAITVESNNAGSQWSKTFKGFSFYSGTGRFEEGTLVSANLDNLPKSYSAKTEIAFNDVLQTCKPFDLKQFTYVYSYAMIDGVKTTFTITQLGWQIESEHISLASLDATSIEAGNHTVQIYVYVIAPQAAFAYSLNLGEVTFA